MFEDPLINMAALTALGVLIVFAVSGGFLALAAWAYPKLKREEQGYPYENEVEPFLLPWLYKAITTAYKTSERAMDELGRRMDGVDKKKIADALYDMLPATLGGIPTGVVKQALTKERFAQLVQDLYDEFDGFYEDQQDRLDQLYKEWVRENPQ